MKITVFTPLYNRAHLISNLYESLKRQQCQRFQWVVVDDGSTDCPEKLFEVWQKEDNNFEIVFVKQANGGKHRAINNGLKHARGKYFVICDSDDYLVDDALSTIETWISETEDLDLIGVAGQKQNQDGELLIWNNSDDSKARYGGKLFFDDYVDLTPADSIKQGMYGDKTEVIKTDIFKRYPFPEFEGENFLTEMVVYNRMSLDNLKLRWYTKPLTVCSYLEDGLTQDSGKFIRNPKGYALYLIEDPDYANTAYQKLANQTYYNDMRGILSEDEIADNLHLADCSGVKSDIIKEKKYQLDKLDVMKQSAITLHNCRQNNSLDNNALSAVEASIRQMLEKVGIPSDEINTIFTNDIQLVLDAIANSCETLNQEIIQLKK